jgi:hypothetical protein
MHTTFKEHKSEKYTPRTYANACRADVTVAIAVDFTTAGEKCTKTAAKKKYVSYDFESDPVTCGELFANHCKTFGVKIVNVAGNGIYTFSRHNYTQHQVNVWMLDFIETLILHYPQITLFISGGQTGVDFSIGVVCELLGLQCEMLFPKGFIQRHTNKHDRSMDTLELEEDLERYVEQLREFIQFRFD